MARFKLTWLLFMSLLVTILASLTDYKTVEVSQSIGKFGVYKKVQQYWTIDTYSQTITLQAFTAGSPAPGGSWKFGQKIVSCHVENEPLVGNVPGCAYMTDLPDFSATDTQYFNINAKCYTNSTQTGTTDMGAWTGTLPNFNLITGINVVTGPENFVNGMFILGSKNVTVEEAYPTNGRGANVAAQDFSLAMACQSGSSVTVGEYSKYEGKKLVLPVPEVSGGANCYFVAKGLHGCFSSDLSCSTLQSPSFLAEHPGVSGINFINSPMLPDGTINSTIAAGGSLSVTPVADYMGMAYQGPVTLVVNCPGFTEYVIEGNFSETFIVPPPQISGVGNTECNIKYTYSVSGSVHSRTSAPFYFTPAPGELNIDYPANEFTIGAPFYVVPTLYSKVGQQLSSPVTVKLNCVSGSSAASTEVVANVTTSTFKSAFLVAPTTVKSLSKCSISAELITTDLNLADSSTKFIGPSTLVADPYGIGFNPNGQFYDMDVVCTSDCTIPSATSSPSAPSKVIVPKGSASPPIDFFGIIDPIETIGSGGSYPVIFLWGGVHFTSDDFVQVAITSTCGSVTSQDSFSAKGNTNNFTIFEPKLKFANGACEISYNVTSNGLEFNTYQKTIAYFDSQETTARIVPFSLNNDDYVFLYNSQATSISLYQLNSLKSDFLYYANTNTAFKTHYHYTGAFTAPSPSVGIGDDQLTVTQFIFVAPKADTYTFNINPYNSDSINTYYGLSCNGNSTGDWNLERTHSKVYSTHTNNMQQYVLQAGEVLFCQTFSYVGFNLAGFGSYGQTVTTVVNSNGESMASSAFGYESSSVVAKYPYSTNDIIPIDITSPASQVLATYDINSRESGSHTNLLTSNNIPSYSVAITHPSYTVVKAPSTASSSSSSSKGDSETTSKSKTSAPSSATKAASKTNADAIMFAATSNSKTYKDAKYQLTTTTFADAASPFSQVLLTVTDANLSPLYLSYPINYTCNSTTNHTGSFDVYTNTMTIIPLEFGQSNVVCTLSYKKASATVKILPPARYSVDEFYVHWTSNSLTGHDHHYYQSLQVIPYSLGYTKYFPKVYSNMTSDDDSVIVKFNVSPSDAFEKPLPDIKGKLLEVIGITNNTLQKNGTISATAIFTYSGKSYNVTTPTLNLIAKSTGAAAKHAPTTPPIIHVNVKPENVHLLFGILPMWWIAVFVLIGLLILICIGGCFTKCYHIKDHIRKRRLRRDESYDNDDDIILEEDPALEGCAAIGADELVKHNDDTDDILTNEDEPTMIA